MIYSCKYHIVWCPKYRRKVLINGVDTRLKELIHEIAKELQLEIIEIEVMPDHVHILLEVDPQFGIHRAVKALKGRTSRILRQEYPFSYTYALDKQLFLFNRWRSTIICNKTIY